MCGPTAGLVMSGVSGIMQIQSTLAEGKAKQDAYNAQAREAMMNNDLAMKQSEEAYFRGGKERDQYERQFGQYQGTQNAVAGAMGRDNTSGSGLDLVLQDLAAKDEDIFAINYNTTQEAYAAQSQAAEYRQNASNLKTAGKNARKMAKYEATMKGIGTAFSLADSAGLFAGSTKTNFLDPKAETKLNIMKNKPRKWTNSQGVDNFNSFSDVRYTT